MARVAAAAEGTLLDAVRRGRAVQCLALPELGELGQQLGSRFVDALVHANVFPPLLKLIADRVAACTSERIPALSGDVVLGGVPATVTLHPMGLLEIAFVLADEPLFHLGANRAEVLEVANAIGSLNTTALGAQLVELRTMLASPHVDAADADKLRRGLSDGLCAHAATLEKLAATSISLRATGSGVTCSIGSLEMGSMLASRTQSRAGPSSATARTVHPAAGALLWSILWPAQTSEAFRFWGFQPRNDTVPKGEHAHAHGVSVSAGRFNVAFAKDGAGNRIDEATLLALLPFAAKRPPEGFGGGETGADELSALRYQTLWDPGPREVQRDRFGDRRDKARAPLRRGDEWAIYTEAYGWVLGRGLQRTWSEYDITPADVRAQRAALPWAQPPARRRK